MTSCLLFPCSTVSYWQEAKNNCNKVKLTKIEGKQNYEERKRGLNDVRKKAFYLFKLLKRSHLLRSPVSDIFVCMVR